jgi:hypothetical protein
MLPLAGIEPGLLTMIALGKEYSAKKLFGQVKISPMGTYKCGENPSLKGLSHEMDFHNVDEN